MQSYVFLLNNCIQKVQKNSLFFQFYCFLIQIMMISLFFRVQSYVVFVDGGGVICCEMGYDLLHDTKMVRKIWIM